ncbi:hypothetical protein DIURU_001772 [Diutina rugosa]|uniref:Dilute domain-containing protein n=1 Tax=Diutina rugosa TaxID=5481 RepID=A0A642USZ8_DIURU|nr:uncharacterized protein DIURU_001772 [Diutina rugosa]KAA8904936.1 hypothetical protein DIURU_001772 [Diutina rugosa]
MDDWIGSGLSSGLSGGFGTSVGSIFADSDPLFAKAKAAKTALKLTLKTTPSVLGPHRETAEILVAVSDGDIVSLEGILRKHPEISNAIYPEEGGLTPLIAAVVFGHTELIERILNAGADPDLADTLVFYSPLMWAIHFDNLDAVKKLLEHQADPHLTPEGQNSSPVDLVKLDKPEIYNYFQTHGLLRPVSGGADYYQEDNNFNDISSRLAQTQLSPTTVEYPSDEESVPDEDSEEYLGTDHTLVALKEFDYDSLARDEYIKFTDSDMPQLLDYMFNLRTKHTKFQHDAKYPAAILFQLLRYADQGVQSKEFTEFIFHCFITRLSSVTDTESGVYNMATFIETGGHDIVLTSYWLAVIQFLHFYLMKGHFYPKYPKFLQELIMMTRSLVVVLSFSINSRLDKLVDSCILDFTSLVDVKEVMYARDWNFYRQKKKHPNSFDDIVQMLYPPSITELMKPSPLRYLQVLGALDYVLRIHNIDNIVRMMAFSQVFYYSNATIFNKIMSSSKYCTRTKAVQIRLNLSAIEDWLRTHSFKAEKNRIGGIEALIDGTHHTINSLLKPEEGDAEHPGMDPHYLDFYYNSLYKVGKIQFNPLIELLQWLQVMSSCTDQEFLITTLNQFDDLNYYQYYKVMNKLYKYEVDEPKLPKKLREYVKQLSVQQGPAQVEASHMHYMTQTTFLTKEEYIYLNPNWIFDVALPNLAEMINRFGSGIGGVRVLRGKKYQPSLPMVLMDDVDEIIQENASARAYEVDDGNAVEVEDEDEDDDYDKDGEEARDEAERDDDSTNSEKLDTENGSDNTYHGDEIFKNVQMPDSLIHRTWTSNLASEFEENPW